MSATPITWCQRHITRHHPAFRFHHINVQNARYNKQGVLHQSEIRLPVADHSTDIVYLYSVFSHLLTDDVRAYLKEFERILAPGGKVLLTAFVETDVPDVTENPAEYGDMTWHGPLHCVRYERDFFERLLTEAGLRIIWENRREETDGQSAYLLERL